MPTIYDLIDDALAIGTDDEGECYNLPWITDNYLADVPFGCMIVEKDSKTILEGIDGVDGVPNDLD